MTYIPFETAAKEYVAKLRVGGSTDQQVQHAVYCTSTLQHAGHASVLVNINPSFAPLAFLFPSACTHATTMAINEHSNTYVLVVPLVNVSSTKMLPCLHRNNRKWEQM